MANQRRHQQKVSPIRSTIPIRQCRFYSSGTVLKCTFLLTRASKVKARSTIRQHRWYTYTPASLKIKLPRIMLRKIDCPPTMVSCQMLQPTLALRKKQHKRMSKFLVTPIVITQRLGVIKMIRRLRRKNPTNLGRAVCRSFTEETTRKVAQAK